MHLEYAVSEMRIIYDLPWHYLDWISVSIHIEKKKRVPNRIFVATPLLGTDEIDVKPCGLLGLGYGSDSAPDI